MTRILSIPICLLLCVGSMFASPTHVDKRRQVSGTVVDYDRIRAILVLKDFTDWDREQMNDASNREKKKIRNWLANTDKKYAAIYIKKIDMEGVRKGSKIEILGYHYIIDEWTVYPEYDTFKISH